MNAEVNFYNLGRNIDELLRKVQANIYLGAHGDEACPVGWKAAGDKTLKPNAAMVGKVYEAMKQEASLLGRVGGFRPSPFLFSPYCVVLI